MRLTEQLAGHLRDVHFGGNWTTVCYRDVLADLSWEQAVVESPVGHSVAALTYHATYYVGVLRRVLAGQPLDGKDAHSFQLPPIRQQADWQQLLDAAWENAEAAAGLLEALPDERLAEVFVAEQYGTYFRNVGGIVEHLHYHLGQIVLTKRLVAGATG